MNHRNRRAAVILALMVLGAAWPTLAAPAASARVTVAEVQGDTTVEAYAGRIVWSALDRATGRYRLMQQTATGQVRTLRIPSRSIPFDVDLGPGPAGRVVAVYSRCATEPPDHGTRPLRRMSEGRGCDLYLYDFRVTRERRLAVSQAGVSETRPAIWRNQLVFTRISDRRRDGRQHLLSYDWSTKRLRSVGQPPQGILELAIGGAGRIPGGGVLSIDLRGNRLSYAWRYEAYRCGVYRRDDGVRVGSPTTTELWTATLDGSEPPRLLERRCDGGSTLPNPSSPTVTPQGVDYRKVDALSATLVRWTRRGSIAADVEPATVLDTTTDNGTVYTVRIDPMTGSGITRILREDPLTYRRYRPRIDGPLQVHRRR